MSATQPVLLITGASGMIGTALAKRLLDRYTIVGFDIEDRQALPHNADFIPMDLTSDQSVAGALAQMRKRHGAKIASVVHLAAYYDFSGEPSELYNEVTVQGSYRLLQALRTLDVEQFVFSSTMLAHGPCEPGQKIDEGWPLAPKWDYPRSKVATEQVLIKEHHDIPLVILRIAGVYNDRCQSIPIAHQIQRIYERRFTSHVYPGDLSRGQAFLHEDDLLDALEHVVDRRVRLPNQAIMLLGEPETVSYGDLQDAIGTFLFSQEWKTVKVPKPMAKAGAWVQEKLPWSEDPFIKPWMIDMADDHYELDIGLATKLLDWQPRHRLLGTLPRMLEALQRDPETWYRENKLDLPKQLRKETAAK